MDACPDSKRLMPHALKTCYKRILKNDTGIRNFRWPFGTRIFLPSNMPTENMKIAADGAIKPLYVNAGISDSPIFKKGHEVPHPIITLIKRK
jgi:hypothetical protein